MNSKYAPLKSHLRDSGKTYVPMTFDEIAQVIGTPLPQAAFKHRALWSNTTHGRSRPVNPLRGSSACAEHDRQLGGASPLSSLMAAKD